MALLLAFDELIRARKVGLRLAVAHLNHNLRGGNGDADARWVRSLAKNLGYRVIVGSSRVSRRAAKTGDNLEQAARRARYEFLEKTAKSVKANVLMTAHTMDDQAETVLLNLLRGSGLEGLRGIDPIRPIQAASKLVLARPLLTWARRADTESYCGDREIAFRVDEMNMDESFGRVRVRRRLLPLMTTFNPNFIQTLTRTTEVLREDNHALETAARRLLELSSNNSHTGGAATLQVDLLAMAEPALRRRALRQWIASVRGSVRRIELAHVIAIENLVLSTKSGRVIELPGGAKIVRQGGRLHYRS